MKTLTLLIVFLAAVSPSVEAAPKPKDTAIEVDRDISLPVPTTELAISTKPKDDKGPTLASFEFAASAWSPKEFSRPTYANGASNFDNSLPLLSVNRHSPLYLFNDLSGFHSKLGISFARLERSGQFTSGSAYVTTQTMNLLSLRFGAEYQGPRYLGDLLQPYAGFSLLPTLALSSQSQMEGSVSRIGLPLEAVGGIMAYPVFLREFAGMTNGAIGVGAHYIFGTVDNSKMNDLGAQGFLRLDI